MISKKFFKIPSYKSKKFSQLISEGVYKMPFSLATYWGDCLPVYLENWIAASKGYASGKCRHDFPIIQGSRKIEDFVGRGAAVKRMSFRTSAEANDMELAATRARQRSDTPWWDSGAGTMRMSGSK